MKTRILSMLGVSLTLLVSLQPAGAMQVTVEVENLAPQGGVYLSPVWVGFDGPQFRLFTTVDTSAPSAALTRLATQGDASILQQEFRQTVRDGVEGLIGASEGSSGAPNLAPGVTARQSFDLDPQTNRYLTFAAKVYPSTDGYIAGEQAIDLFTADGQFKGKQIITILGSEILRATTKSGGTDESDSDRDTATSTSADTTAKTSLVMTDTTTATVSGSDLSRVSFDPVASDCSLPNAVIARITVVPEPATIFLLAGGSLALLSGRRGSRRR